MVAILFLNHFWHVQKNEYSTHVCKHIIHLYYHGISKCVYNFKKSESYMTKLPFVIQEMNNKNKCINTSPQYLKIKRYNACITWLKAKETNISFVCSIIIGKKLFLNFCHNGKFNWGFCLKINLLKKGASTNDKGINSFVMNNTRSFSNFLFMNINIFLIRNITTQIGRNNVRS